MAIDLELHTEKITAKFWSKVQRGPGCWEWAGYKSGKAGTKYASGNFFMNRDNMAAHRVMWSNYVGPIPPGFNVCRRCDNPLCVNPDHLYVAAGIAGAVDGDLLFRTEKNRKRFWKSVVKSNGCWEWTGCHGYYGHGYIHMNRRGLFAHRIMYANYVGPIPDGLNVCHKCDNPSCVNPEHLFLGTQKDNIMDCINKGRANTRKGSQCPQAKLTEESVKIIRQHLNAGKLTYAQVGDIFDVTKSCISVIANGKNWLHVV